MWVEGCHFPSKLIFNYCRVGGTYPAKDGIHMLTEIEDDLQFVCCDCIGDAYLKAEIKAEGKCELCTICGNCRRSIAFDALCERVHQIVREEFERTASEPDNWALHKESDYDWEREGEQIEEILYEILECDEPLIAAVKERLSDLYFPSTKRPQGRKIHTEMKPTTCSVSRTIANCATRGRVRTANPCGLGSTSAGLSSAAKCSSSGCSSGRAALPRDGRAGFRGGGMAENMGRNGRGWKGGGATARTGHLRPIGFTPPSPVPAPSEDRSQARRSSFAKAASMTHICELWRRSRSRRTEISDMPSSFACLSFDHPLARTVS